MNIDFVTQPFWERKKPRKSYGDYEFNYPFMERSE